MMSAPRIAATIYTCSIAKSNGKIDVRREQPGADQGDEDCYYQAHLSSGQAFGPAVDGEGQEEHDEKLDQIDAEGWFWLSKHLDRHGSLMKEQVEKASVGRDEVEISYAVG
jgi:hypothetical protein